MRDVLTEDEVINQLERDNGIHPADEPDENEEAPEGPYDKLPPQEPMRRKQEVFARRDLTRNHFPYGRFLRRVTNRHRRKE